MAVDEVFSELTSDFPEPDESNDLRGGVVSEGVEEQVVSAPRLELGLPGWQRASIAVAVLVACCGMFLVPTIALERETGVSVNKGGYVGRQSDEDAQPPATVGEPSGPPIRLTPVSHPVVAVTSAHSSPLPPGGSALPPEPGLWVRASSVSSPLAIPPPVAVGPVPLHCKLANASIDQGRC